ncbi:MAG TPA: arylsulfotransferase family protein [Solirubrobacteraceae bacterium]|jgi:hypothetical protein|nr:arylsulfotransferase family protein [Solirubrobacteraceae bacterium]
MKTRAPGALAVLAALVSAACARAAVVLSPLPGTPDASPTTQLSILGVPAGGIASVRMVGSRSGAHLGALRAYASAPGASYLPRRSFVPGETVVAQVRLTSGRALRTSFLIGRYVPHTPLVGPRARQLTGPGVQQLLSRPDLRPPLLDVRTDTAAAARAGDLFLAPIGGLAQGAQIGESGPLILGPRGGLVWFHPLPPGVLAMNFHPIGHGELAWWQGDFTAVGYGIGQEMIVGPSYRLRQVVRAGNGLQMDLHDFLLLAGGSAYVTAYVPVAADLRRWGGPENGAMLDCVIQRIDLRTGLVMWEWHAFGHQRPGDSYGEAADGSFDPFHLNSLALDGRTLLVSERDSWEILDLSLSTGHILWRLGGRHSSFALAPGARFAWQHSARPGPHGTIAVFDNEGSGGRPTSRALVLGLQPRRHRAVLVRADAHPSPPLFSFNQGNVQWLGDGGLFVDWGAQPWISQFSAGGTLLFDAELPATDETYRAFRAPWSAQPAGAPALATRPSAGGGATLYASWNGATDVADWAVRAGGRRIDEVPFRGFQTAIPLVHPPVRVDVQALGAGGRVLGTSPTLVVSSVAPS